MVVALATASVLSKLEGREAVRLMEVKLEVKDWKAGGWRKQGREGPGTGRDVSVQGSDHGSVPAHSHPTGLQPSQDSDPAACSPLQPPTSQGGTSQRGTPCGCC